jgi:hypothetical protein
MARRPYRRQYNGTTRLQQGIQTGYSLPAKQHGHESQCAPGKGCQRRKRPNEEGSKAMFYGEPKNFLVLLNRRLFSRYDDIAHLPAIQVFHSVQA